VVKGSVARKGCRLVHKTILITEIMFDGAQVGRYFIAGVTTMQDTPSGLRGEFRQCCRASGNSSISRLGFKGIDGRARPLAHIDGIL
jgi:hypothetical protein